MVLFGVDVEYWQCYLVQVDMFFVDLYVVVYQVVVLVELFDEVVKGFVGEIG